MCLLLECLSPRTFLCRKYSGRIFFLASPLNKASSSVTYITLFIFILHLSLDIFYISLYPTTPCPSVLPLISGAPHPLGNVLEAPATPCFFHGGRRRLFALRLMAAVKDNTQIVYTFLHLYPLSSLLPSRR